MTDLATFPLRLNARATGIALGLLCGLVMFFATIVLVIKGGPTVGQHLQLLGAYLPGYEVTVAGSFVGFVYAAVIGYVAGWTIGRVYNALARGGRPG